MKPALPKFVHLNGRVVPTTQARISVFDRGLLYGDGVFETLRAYHGRTFTLDQHLARVRASAGLLGMAFPRRAWQRDIDAVLERNGLLGMDAWVRITLTRGVGAPGLLPPGRLQPTLIISAGRVEPSIARSQRDGVRVTLLPFARHGVLAEHKVLAYLPGVLGKVMAARHGAFEGLFVDGDGHVTEGTTTNVFIRRGRQLFTPLTAGILPGVTRRLVIEAAVADGLRVQERPLAATEVLAADEAFLTSSVVEVVPITAVDDHAIGDSRVGPGTRRLQHLYRQMVDQATRKHGAN
jgi:branched-chain amino acid aminotransferase